MAPLGLGRCVLLLAGVRCVHVAVSRVLARVARMHRERAMCAGLAGVFSLTGLTGSAMLAAGAGEPYNL